MKVPLNHFEGQEIERVYLASSLADAKKVEEALEASPFTFTLDLEKFAGEFTGIFGGGVGVAFYVEPPHAPACKQYLRGKGFTYGLEDDEPGKPGRKHGFPGWAAPTEGESRFAALMRRLRLFFGG